MNIILQIGKNVTKIKPIIYSWYLLEKIDKIQWLTYIVADTDLGS